MQKSNDFKAIFWLLWIGILFNEKDHAFSPRFCQILIILHAARNCLNLAVNKCELQDDIAKYAEKCSLNTLKMWWEPQKAEKNPTHTRELSSINYGGYQRQYIFHRQDVKWFCGGNVSIRIFQFF